MGENISKRDELILDKLVNEGMTLTEVGNLVGVSRERVRQIYTNYYGVGVMELARKRNKKRANNREEEILYLCSVCGVAVKRKDSVSYYRRRKLCSACAKLSKENKYRDITRKVKCVLCGSYFYPYKDTYRKNGRRIRNKYCSAQCYRTVLKEQPIAKKREYCKYGHKLSGDNLYEFTTSKGERKRICKKCQQIRKVRYYFNKKDKQND